MSSAIDDLHEAAFGFRPARLYAGIVLAQLVAAGDHVVAKLDSILTALARGIRTQRGPR